MKVIGVDYGGKRVGIALSDESRTIAFPHVTVDARDAVERVVELVRVEEASAVVVGESVDGRGAHNRIAGDAERFAESLRERVPIPVLFENESFTSHHASQPVVRRRGVLSRPRPAPAVSADLDASAAALILQRHLDRSRPGV